MSSLHLFFSHSNSYMLIDVEGWFYSNSWCWFIHLASFCVIQFISVQNKLNIVHVISILSEAKRLTRSKCVATILFVKKIIVYIPRLIRLQPVCLHFCYFLCYCCSNRVLFNRPKTNPSILENTQKSNEHTRFRE